VAQKQISATAGNRTSLLHRVLKEQPVCYRRRKKTDVFPYRALLSKSEINFYKAS
jgi:hypothetical protein